jgi:drug/metabolite transporter (DMT)-like permease
VTLRPRVGSTDRLTVAAFGLSVLLGGANAIGVRLRVAELPPFWGATLRFALAGALLLLVVFLRRIPLPRGQRLLGSALYGIFGFGLSYVFLYWALQRAPAGAALMGALTLVTDEKTGLPTRPETWLAVGYLVIFGSIAVFVLSLYVLARWTASASSYAFLLVPLVTVVLAAVILGEQLKPTLVAGAGLVLAGVYLGAFYRPGRSA